MKIKKIIKALLPYGLVTSGIDVPLSFFAKSILNLFLTKDKYFSVRENSVLLVEALASHGEILPGFTKYLLDLNYNVDIIFNMQKGKRNSSQLFSCFSQNDKVRIKILSYYDINLFLRSSNVKNYEHIVLSSFYDTMKQKYLYKINLYELKPVVVMHNDNITDDYFTGSKKISLVKMEYMNRKPPLVVNPHYFGEFNTTKEKENCFFTFNMYDLVRRNLFLLFSACDKLYEKGITNFSVKIMGDGLPIPDRFHKNFQVLGYLDFQKMYNEIAESDFILALIDQANVRYTNKASGSYQLSYGFNKPIILHRKFSDIAGFNNDNSILYDNNDCLVDAMETCINMPKDEYSALVHRLEASEKLLYNNSLNNFRKALEASI